MKTVARSGLTMALVAPGLLGAKPIGEAGMGLRSGAGPIILGGVTGSGMSGEWSRAGGPGPGEFVAMRFIQVTILLVFLAAVAAFAIQNNELVSLEFLVWRLNAPMAAMIVGIYLLGMISGGAVLGFIRRSIRKASEIPASDYQR